jgi:hypothetical protein
VNAPEWRYLRRVYSIRMGVEDKLISVRPDGVHQIFLVANETVTIPFIFQSFVASSTNTITEGSEVAMNPVSGRKMNESEEYIKTSSSGIHPRIINVSRGLMSTFNVILKLFFHRSHSSTIVNYLWPCLILALTHAAIRLIVRSDFLGQKASYCDDQSVSIKTLGSSKREYLSLNQSKVVLGKTGTKIIGILLSNQVRIKS